jgi:hypothetical protein
MMLINFIEWSIEGMVLAPLLPHVWIAVAALVIVIVRVRSRPARSRPWGELLLLAAGPLAILLWGALLAASLEYRASSPWQWQETGPHVLFAAEAVLALWLVQRHRARLTAAAICAFLAILWSGGALFIASMSVTGDWL